MHNHPSGEPTPSEASIKVTRDLIHEPVRYGLFYALGRGQPAIESLATLSLTLLSMGIVLGIAQVSSQYLERPLIQRAHRRHRYDSPSPEGGGLCVRTT